MDIGDLLQVGAARITSCGPRVAWSKECRTSPIQACRISSMPRVTALTELSNASTGPRYFGAQAG